MPSCREVYNKTRKETPIIILLYSSLLLFKLRQHCQKQTNHLFNIKTIYTDATIFKLKILTLKMNNSVKRGNRLVILEMSRIALLI